MIEMSLSEQLTYSTVLIQCIYKNHLTGSGTGFIINICRNPINDKYVPIIVTNKHVIKDAEVIGFSFCRKNEKGDPVDTEVVNINVKEVPWIMHPNSDVDLCCMPLVPVLKLLEDNKLSAFYIPLDTSLIPNANTIRNLRAIEDVTMLGYPIGLSDKYNHKPIIRRGITATHIKNDYNGKKEFAVDMACFPGSSGSPIFILNEGGYTDSRYNLMLQTRILLIGVLYAVHQQLTEGAIVCGTIPNTPHTVTGIPIGLGIGIKSELILDFEQFFNNEVFGNSCSS